jgi:predicted nucleic acid-binding protein
MLYLDTSVLVAATTNEPRTIEVLAWFDLKSSEELSISDWVVTEFSSALSIKLRTRQIEAAERADALAAFARLCADALAILPVSRAQFRTAARFADQHALGLSGSDALHLAICGDQGATLCTLDRRLSEACAAVGVSATLL